MPTPVTRLGIEPPPPPELWPVVVKPRFGAGCERTFLCRGRLDLDELPPHDDWIVQPLVEGVAASAAFLVNDSMIRPLQAGRQFIGGKHQFFYHGGEMPLAPELWRRAMALGEQAVRAVVLRGRWGRWPQAAAGRGLHGYVGVDLVLGGRAEDDRVIEINPRLTVAYVGMRALCRNNLAAAILDHAAPLEWRGGRVRYDASGHGGVGGGGVTTLALDIGGANIKAAYGGGPGSRLKPCEIASVAFALWKEPGRLAEKLAEIAARFNGFDRVLVTMTAELCDCFETKRAGVGHVLDAVEEMASGGRKSAKPQAAGAVGVWTTEGRFVSVREARAEPIKAAASNWHALATFVAGLYPGGPSLLIDTGSTTTDIIRLRDGQPDPSRVDRHAAVE